MFVESIGEIMDIELYEDMNPDALMNKLNEFLHADCRVLTAINMPDKHEAIEIECKWARYEGTLSKKYLKKNEINDIIKSVLDEENIFTERTNKKGFKKQVNIRKSIGSIKVIEERDDSIKIAFVLKATNSNSNDEDIPILRADDFMKIIFPEFEWEVLRVELLDENKKGLV
ncbi:MAG: DUF2344 domain-containing protein [Candidatus Gastranaerophilales bacterium]|nr:DUF2344 domain-containing protein [Candidatus Gastranaerophilales bacterium]